MVFTEDFFDKLPNDLTQACKLICDTFMAFNLSISTQQEVNHYEEYIDAYAALEAFILTNNFESEIQIPQLTSEKTKNIAIIIAFFGNVLKKMDGLLSVNILESSRFKYKTKLGNVFSYKFSDGDLEKIQGLINDLRNKINASELFSINHKERLLQRLEGLQKELHKRMSNLDKFWGLIGDAGVVLGKFGNDAKPFVDRIKDITDIVWRAQSSAEELPSGTNMPMLNKTNKEA